MSSDMKIDDNIVFSKAIKNPFAKIAKANKDHNGSLSEDVRKKMMKEAIAEVRRSFAN